jgi:hypothetical protein
MECGVLGSPRTAAAKAGSDWASRLALLMK